MTFLHPRMAVACLAMGLAGSASAADNQSVNIHGQPSFVIRSPQVQLAVTEIGGHMAPVTFLRDTGRPIQPYYISPWQDEPAKSMPAPVLVPLRGDFFCLPFGGNAEAVKGEKHPPHGEVSSARWQFGGVRQTNGITTLTLSMDTKVRAGRVVKQLSLVDGHNVVYGQHTITGFAGPTPLGHHATLPLPGEPGALRVSTSPIKFGMTAAGTFSDPRQREYQQLLPGVRWSRLEQVPVAWKGLPDADLTRQPGAYGFADLVQLVSEAWDTLGGPAWVTATHRREGYVWFALKDPALLNSTVIWIENHGRHGHPWNGRNQCIGLEDVTASFADGLATAIGPNPLQREGVATTVMLSAQRPTVVNYIQGVARVPAGFEVVERIEFAPGAITLVAPNGLKVTIPVRHEFLRSGKL